MVDWLSGPNISQMANSHVGVGVREPEYEMCREDLC